jgi:hypothetical protein
MDDATQSSVCKQCGSPPEAGSIFCRNYGATLEPPVPLTPLSAQDVNGSASSTSSTNRLVLTVIRGVAGIAAVVFWLCPLSTWTQAILFVASIFVLLICHFSLSNLDDAYLDEHKDGYWPPKPIDWNPLPAGKKNASENGAAVKHQAQNPRRPAVS